jgi:hypothetical protein
MKTLNLKEMEVIEGGRFLGWGWKKYGGTKEVDSYADCGGGPALTWNEVYTVFWLETPSLGYKPNHKCL